MRTAALALAAASWLSTLHARADERPILEALSVASADDCVTTAAVATHLGTWLGRATLDARIAIVVEIGDGEASFEILSDSVPSGSRRFDRLPAECADRRAVISLAIALALDGGVLDALAAAPVDDGGAASEPGPMAPTPRAPEPSAPVTPASSSGPGVAFQVEAAALVGLLFDPVLFGAVDVRVLMPEGLSLRLGGAVSAMASGALGAARVEVSLALGRASLCLGRAVAAPVVLEGCIGLWAGAVRAEGRGFTVDRAVELGLVAPAARLEARIEPLAWLALFVAVEGVAAVLRPQVQVEGSGASRDLGDVGLTLGGGGAIILR